jgi:hypothetical protein
MFQRGSYFHDDAHYWTKTFWNALLKPNIDFRNLPTMIYTIYKSERNARRCYEKVLDSLPGDERALKAYANLQLDVYRDQNSADLIKDYLRQLKDDLDETDANADDEEKSWPSPAATKNEMFIC